MNLYHNTLIWKLIVVPSSLTILNFPIWPHFPSHSFTEFPNMGLFSNLLLLLGQALLCPQDLVLTSSQAGFLLASNRHLKLPSCPCSWFASSIKLSLTDPRPRWLPTHSGLPWYLWVQVSSLHHLLPDTLPWNVYISYFSRDWTFPKGTNFPVLLFVHTLLPGIVFRCCNARLLADTQWQYLILGNIYWSPITCTEPSVWHPFFSFNRH